ncbi:MAG: hypothetical protein AB7S75_23690 [Desulfococcaceae bacterium]
MSVTVDNKILLEADMQAYSYEHTVGKKGILILENLPFDAGDKIEVILIPRLKPKENSKRYPFWGKPITYLNPTEPVTEADGYKIKI